MENNGMREIALIPAYMPEGVFIDILTELDQNGFTSVVVDDGSGKEFEKVFDEASKYASVISYPENRGKGYALKKGFEYILENFGSSVTVITLDADGQHKIPDAMRVLEMSRSNPGKLVLGSRDLSGKIPLRSKIGNSITTHLFKWITKNAVSDTQTGLRAFSGDMLDMLMKIDGDRYEYEMNMLLYVNKAKYRIIEVPIKTVYISNNSSSHFNPLKDSLKIYSQMIKFAFRKKN